MGHIIKMKVEMLSTKTLLNKICFVNVCRLLMVRGINYSVRKCLPLTDGAGYNLFGA